MADNFAAAMMVVMKWEGGGKFTDDPQDNGGATCWGITQATLSEHRGCAVTKTDVRTLGFIEAAKIYRRQYWQILHCDDLPAGLDLACFDCAVNMGIGRAKKLLQRAAGVTEDAMLGPKSLAAIAAMDTKTAIKAIGEYRAEHYRRLDDFPRFGRGWLNRVADVTAKALTWVR